MAISLYKDVKCKGYDSYYSYRADIKENSYSIVDNTSNVTIDFYMNAYGYSAGFSSYNSCQYGIWIDGTKKGGGQSATTTVNSGSTYIKIGSWTGNVAHNTDGTKTITVGLTFRCNASVYYSDSYLPCQNDGSTSYPSGTALIWNMGEVKLTTIPRASTLTASNGTLGTTQTLKVTQYSTSFTHTITAKCGTSSTTLCTKSSSTSISYTPPISLASQNTTGTSVSVTFTITTYSGDTSIGSSTKTISCAMPASVKPSCSISVSDNAEYYSTYGAYVQSQSEFKIVISATQSYGASIKSYKTTVDGSTYTESSFTTDVIKGSGTLTISCTVTDSRGRTGTATVDVTVLAYSAPVVSALNAVRCDSDGTANVQGEYIKITFSGAVTSLNNNNTAVYTAIYKKASETSATYAELTDYEGNYSVSSGTYIFAADTGSTYSVSLEIEDNFSSDSKSAGAPTAFAIMHWKSDGTAIGIGKIAEEANTLDMGVRIKMNGNRITNLGTPVDGADALTVDYGNAAFAPNGYGWGISGNGGKLVTDLNTAVIPGFYICNGLGTLNSPGGNMIYSTVLVQKRHNAIYQKLTSNDGFTVAAEAVRYSGDGGSTWEAWQWQRPPLVPDTEYRTTEMFRNSPVFVKLVDIGYFPNKTQKEVTYSTASCSPIRVSGYSNSPGFLCAFPYFDLYNYCSVSANGNTVRIFANYDLSAQYGCILVHYIKT